MEKDADCKFLRNNAWWLVPVLLFVLIIVFDIKLKTYWLVDTSKHTINTPIFTIFATLLGLIGYSVRQKQKLVAEQIAKSRIDWLKEMREHVANYITSVNVTYDYRMNHTNMADDKIKKEYRELKQKVEKNYALIMFNLNPKEKITKQLNDYLQLANEPITMGDKKEAETALDENVQAFFKSEWDKAKKEIQSGRVDK
ncbi:hypothetical protein [Lactiplantibacillus herbarum]|uniref:hypothetical protein n=1 Tax=Lactiplantibacillus herbarum TaxID=1670446 RepID=UPI00064E349A|nr:hypothetical protein [Lactiplantibacillus herbarum]